MLGLGLSPAMAINQINGWLPETAVWGANFSADEYYLNDELVPFSTFASFSRSSSGSYLDGVYQIQTFSTDEPRIGDKGILLEPAGENLSLGGTLSGAAVGVVGSGGALPTYWVAAGINTTEITEISSENGFDYISLRLTLGTGSARIRLMSSTDDIAIVPSDIITHSVYIKNIGETGDTVGRERRHGILWYNSSKAFLSAALASMPSGAGNFGSQRPTLTATSPANSAYISHEVFWNPGAVNTVLLGIAAPQLEISSKATSYINPATPARQADVLTLNVPDGTFTIDVISNTGVTQTFTSQVVSGGTGWTVPVASLSTPYVRRIIGY